MKTKRNLWYFGLEPLKERYTYQLSEEWMPETFKNKNINFISLKGDKESEEINVGSVLDAYGRGVYSMSQCKKFMKAIAVGSVNENDIVLLQDFWTPGIEAVFYMLDLYKIKIKFYSMLHAQSVDEYDFTHAMKKWIRHFELGIDSRHSGIFVGSSIHKHQLRDAGFKAPIHVVSLPIHKELALKVLTTQTTKKKKNIVYTSRLDKEKNPFFMIKVADEFLRKNPDYEWIVTTSGTDFKSSDPDFIEYLYKYSKINNRFVLAPNLTKEEYYYILSTAAIQFNSSLQDYVSWTLIESTMFNCDVVYPNFRSFPEILDERNMYKPFIVNDAVSLIEERINEPLTHQRISDISDLGRRIEAYIMLNDITEEYNVWHESEKFFNIL